MDTDNPVFRTDRGTITKVNVNSPANLTTITYVDDNQELSFSQSSDS